MHEPHTSPNLFNRPPRIYRRWRSETVELPTPPAPLERHNQGGWITIGMPILSAAVMIGATAAISQGGYGLLLGIPMAAMAIMGVIASLLGNYSSARQAASELAQRQAFFETQLQERSIRLQQLSEQEQSTRNEMHPKLEQLLRIAGALGTGMPPQERLWERRLADTDFLEFSVGCGEVPFSTTVKVPQPRQDDPVDPRLFALAQRYRMIDTVPIVMPLRELGSLGIAGPRPECLALLRALIWQAAVFHAPTDLRLAFAFPNEAIQQWEWAAWLPHTIPFNNDADFSMRMIASGDGSAGQLMSNLLDQLSRRRDLVEQQREKGPGSAPQFSAVLVAIDSIELVRDQPAFGQLLRDGPHYNMYTLMLCQRWEDIPGECSAMLDLQPESPRWARARQQWVRDRFVVDMSEATVRKSDQLARRLAAIRLAEPGSSQDVPRSVRLFDLLDIADENALKPPIYWATPPQRTWHPDVPVGMRAGGNPLSIDLYEHSHGPHGIIAGATGAGKSVLLQSVIAGLAIKHSPKQMQLLLIDFKGGASLAQLSQLPHVVGFVTDLEGRLAERAMTAIKSEIQFRKRQFRKAEAQVESKVENISEYRAKAYDMPPLPNLLIVIDEFDEMVQSYRDFVVELVRVVKQGRSLGIHLLLASQQPSKAVTEDIRSQLKYFLVLRLGSSEDSREMLQKPDAAFLPTDIPGRAYFRVGSDTILFQVAQVTGAYHPRGTASLASDDEIEIIDAGAVPLPIRPSIASSSTGQRESDLDVLVRAMREAGSSFLQQEFELSGWRPRAIWQPPLPAHLVLAELGSVNMRTLEKELVWAWRHPTRGDTWLRAPIGRTDIPQESRQEPFQVNLADGHVGIVGASGTGKTMLLRTLLLSLAITHAPRDVWYYLIDAGGHGLSQLADLPHTGSLIQARDRERVRRLFNLIAREIRRRQEQFRTVGATDLAAYRRQNDAPLAAWVVVIDNIAMLREEFTDKSGYDTISEELVRLVRAGRPYGIHFVITASNVRDLAYPLFSLLDTRIALRLPELYDYTEVTGGRLSSQLPLGLPGRGLCASPEHGILETQIALPLLEVTELTHEPGNAQAAVLESELHDTMHEAVVTMRATWERLSFPDAAQPARIELLPPQLALHELMGMDHVPIPSTETIEAPIGQEGINLESCALRFGPTMPHNLIIGGRRSGKTTTLHTALIGLARRYSSRALRFVIVDIRRGLKALGRLPHTAAYATSEAEVQTMVDHFEMGRLGHGQSRWILVIDDYDLGCKNLEQQFKQSWDRINLNKVLQRLIAEGCDRGVHLLIAANLRYAEEYGDVIRAIEAERNGLILWPHKFDGGTRLLDIALPLGERDTEQPPGRALLVQEDWHAPVQVAHANNEDIHTIVSADTAHGEAEMLHLVADGVERE